MREFLYAGELMDDDEDGDDLIFDGHAEVIDLPLLRPEHEAITDFLGLCIGVFVVYLIAGIWWLVWGIAWTVVFVVAALRPKERS